MVDCRLKRILVVAFSILVMRRRILIRRLLRLRLMMKRYRVRSVLVRLKCRLGKRRSRCLRLVGRTFLGIGWRWCRVPVRKSALLLLVHRYRIWSLLRRMSSWWVRTLVIILILRSLRGGRMFRVLWLRRLFMIRIRRLNIFSGCRLLVMAYLPWIVVWWVPRVILFLLGRLYRRRLVLICRLIVVVPCLCRNPRSVLLCRIGRRGNTVVKIAPNHSLWESATYKSIGIIKSVPPSSPIPVSTTIHNIRASSASSVASSVVPKSSWTRPCEAWPTSAPTSAPSSSNNSPTPSPDFD